jgi:hypothetical protein
MTTACSPPAHRLHPLRLLATLGLLLALANPLLPISRAAQDEITCPEGQVVDETTGTCVAAAPARETPPPDDLVPVTSEPAPAELVGGATEPPSEPTKEVEPVVPPEEATGPAIPIAETEPVDIPAAATGTATSANRCESPILRACGDSGLDVIALKYTCPQVPAPTGLTSYEEHLAVCEPVGVGVTFTFDAAKGHGPEVRVTSLLGATGVPGARWEDQPFGPFTLTESPLADHLPPIVFCDVDYGPRSDAWQRVALDGWSYHGEVIEGDYPDGSALVCAWFNRWDQAALTPVSTEDGEPAIAVARAERDCPPGNLLVACAGPGDGLDVIVFKYRCPSGTDPTGLTSYEAHLAACETAGDLVPFTFDAAQGRGPEVRYTWPLSADGTGAYATRWEDQPFGPFTMTESRLVSYLPPAAFCDVKYAPKDERWDRVVLNGWSYQGKLVKGDYPDGSALVCAWFNFPEWSVFVDIQKFACPPGTTASTYNSFDGFNNACVEPQAGIAFTVSHEAAPSTTRATGEWGGSEWEVYFGPVPFGAFTVSEEIPAGYGDPVVYCDGVRVDAPGGVYMSTAPAPDPPGDVYVRCLWFNLPEG